MELVELLDQALAQTTFLGEDRTVLSTEELRQALSESHWGTSDRKQALSTLTPGFLMLYWSLWQAPFSSGWKRTSMPPVVVLDTPSRWLTMRVGVSGSLLTTLLNTSRSHIGGVSRVP